MGEKPNFSGLYSLEESENLDEFMIANGCGFMFRKVAGVVKPDVEIIQEGDIKLTQKTISTFYTNETTFVIGEQKEEKQADGRVMLVTLTWDGDILRGDYEPKEEGGGKKQHTTRELQGDLMIVKLYVDDIVAKRVYRRKPAQE